MAFSGIIDSKGKNFKTPDAYCKLLCREFVPIYTPPAVCRHAHLALSHNRVWVPPSFTSYSVEKRDEGMCDFEQVTWPLFTSVFLIYRMRTIIVSTFRVVMRIKWVSTCSIVSSQWMLVSSLSLSSFTNSVSEFSFQFFSIALHSWIDTAQFQFVVLVSIF